MDSVISSSNLDSQKKLSRVNLLLLSVLGVDKELAAEHWEDGPILITLSLQLIGTFFITVFFTVGGILRFIQSIMDCSIYGVFIGISNYFC
jgi:hypothetical protein